MAPRNKKAIDINLPSGRACEAIATGNQYPLQLLIGSVIDEPEWPYKIEIAWACFSRKYRYRTREAYDADLEVLKRFCDTNTKISYI